MFPSTSGIVAALTLIPLISAHSWNEQLSLIGSNGSYIAADGYPRGYVARTDPGYNGNSMEYLLPALTSDRTRVDDTDLLCHPSQRTPTQAANWPRLTVAPGSAVAMKYLENGHVTLPQNQPGKPPKAGTVYVFGTTQPLTDEKLTTVMQWNSAGTGGDKRGRLLAAENFDDGRCHQLNSGAMSLQRQQEFPDRYPDQPTSQAEQWCETDVVLPSSLTVGIPLAVYWIWQWPTAPGAPGLPDGKDEYYTTCSDFDVVAQGPEGPVASVLLQQDPQTTACSDYKSRTAITPVPQAEDYGPGFPDYSGPGAIPAATPTSTPIPAAAAPSPTIIANMGDVEPSPSPSGAHGPPVTFVTLTQTHTVYKASAAAANAVVTLAPGQGVMMGANGEMVTFVLPGGVATPAKVKRDEVGEPVPKPEELEDDLIDVVAAQVAGSHRYRIGGAGQRRSGALGYRRVKRAAL